MHGFRLSAYAVIICYFLLIVSPFQIAFSSKSWPFSIAVCVVFGYVVVTLFRFINKMSGENTAVSYFNSLSKEDFSEIYKETYKGSSNREGKINYFKAKSGPILSKGSIAVEIIVAIFMRYQSGTALHCSEIISETVDKSFNKMRFLLGIGGNTCIGIGILGTFYGVAQALRSTGMKIEELPSALKLSVGCSLIGISAAIALLIISKLFDSFEAPMYDLYSNFALTKLFPLFQLQNKYMITVDEHAAEQIGNKIAVSVSNSLDNVFGDLKKT